MNCKGYKLAILCLICFFAGCSDSGILEQKTVIRFWNGYTGPDGRMMLRMVTRFNAENQDVKVIMQRMDWATFYNKLFVAGMSDRAPEVFIVHNDALERFIYAGFIQPLDEFIEGENGIDLNDFESKALDVVTRERKHYAIPLDIYAVGLYYNKDLFVKAGIIDKKGEALPPTTRDEFLSAAQKMTLDTDGDGINDQWGFVFTIPRHNIFTIMKQFGGEFFTEDRKRAIFDNPQNIAALQFALDLIQKYKVAPKPQNIDSWIGFRQGKVGMAIEGIYMLADLQRQQDLDFSGAPIPLLGKQPAVWAGSSNFCITTGMKKKKQQAAWRFIKFFSDNSLDWAASGQIPSRKSLRNTEEFRKMDVQYQFSKQVPYVAFQPHVPFVFEFASEFDVALEKALVGSASPKEALQTAVSNVNKVIERWNEKYNYEFE